MNKLRLPAFLLLLACCLADAGCKDKDPAAGRQTASGDDAILEKPPYRSLTDSIGQASADSRTAPATMAELYFRRAERLSHNNLHEQALPDYQKSWELAPTENTGLRYAATLSITGKTEEAAALLQDCHRRFPANPTFASLLGDLYQQAGRFGQALKVYDEMLQKDSANFEAWYEKGLLLEKGKDTSAAILALAKAYNLQPIGTYGLELAHLYAEKGDSRALDITDQILAKDLNHELVDPVFIKGIYYSNTGQYKKAIAQYDSCIRRDWKFTDAYLEKGIVLFHQHKYEEALGIFQLSVKVSNTYPDGYYWIGRCYEITGRKVDAIIYYQRALSLDKEFTEAAEAIKRLK